VTATSSSAAPPGFQHWRGLATRYDKTARNSLGGLHLASILLWAHDLAHPEDSP
jgi:transposase